MGPRRAFTSLVLLVALAAVAVIIANRSSDGPSAASSVPTAETHVDAANLPVQAESAPLVASATWINTPPLDAAALRGKVVLYDFWTFECSNCQATLPYVKAWYARYASDGLIVLSIHTPEFDRERDPAAVRQFVRDHGIGYPVALDPDSAIWRSFDNHYWPAFYLHDRDGRRRLTHFGEGSYAETENAIRALLGVADSSARAVVPT